MPSDTPERKIILTRPVHVYYKHINVDKANDFLLDFGFAEEKRVDDKIYYRGYGPDPFVYCLEKGDEDAFGGVAFEVESKADLEYASKTLPGASSVYELIDAPGGGRCVTFHDPVDGFPFHLVFGQSMRDGRRAETSDAEELPNGNPLALRFNFPEDKQRPAGKFQRFKKAPAPVYKLGHVGICVTDFQKAFDFYTSRFNFISSELLHIPDSGKVFNTFCRLDRGKELVDHHCFFFFEGPKWHVHHSSFETHDFDTQVLGHDYLRHKGWENCWGVGRHIMGSQIFDYWFDASRFILEHYVDGDLLDNTYPTQKSAASPDGIHVWGPDLPAGFLS